MNNPANANKKYLQQAFIATLVFILIALSYKAPFIRTVDDNVYTFVSSFAGSNLTKAAEIISDIGSELFIVPFIAALLFSKKTRAQYGIPLGFCVGFSAILSVALKQVFKRARPDVLPLVYAGGYSFPSSHSMNNMALYGLLAIIFSHTLRGTKRTVCIFFCISLTVAIGISRIYLGVHYFSDVCGGFTAGFSLSLITAYLVNLLQTKKQ